MVWSGRGCGGGQSRSAVMQYCHGDLRGPFHTGFFSLHCELGVGGGVAIVIPRPCHDLPKRELCFHLLLGSLGSCWCRWI